MTSVRIAWVIRAIVCQCTHPTPNLSVRSHRSSILNGGQMPSYMSSGAVPEDFPVTEQERNLRRDRKRRTKMVIDNGGIRTLRAARKNISDGTLATEVEDPAQSDRRDRNASNR